MDYLSLSFEDMEFGLGLDNEHLNVEYYRQTVSKKEKHTETQPFPGKNICGSRKNPIL